MKVEIKTGTRRVKHIDRFGVEGTRSQFVVELVVGGVSYYHECTSSEEAMKLATAAAFDLGLK